jgi:hypothetical protein
VGHSGGSWSHAFLRAVMYAFRPGDWLGTTELAPSSSPSPLLCDREAARDAETGQRTCWHDLLCVGHTCGSMADAFWCRRLFWCQWWTTTHLLASVFTRLVDEAAYPVSVALWASLLVTREAYVYRALVVFDHPQWGALPPLFSAGAWVSPSFRHGGEPVWLSPLVPPLPVTCAAVQHDPDALLARLESFLLEGSVLFGREMRRSGLFSSLL